LSFNTPDDKIVGFLRLSLPQVENTPAIPDLHQAAIIREVHVYGQSLEVGAEQAGAAQHIGLGSQLLLEAERIAREHNFKGLAVISAVGTRNYYAERGLSSASSICASLSNKTPLAFDTPAGFHQFDLSLFDEACTAGSWRQSWQH